MWTNQQKTLDLFAFTKEMFNVKLHGLCSSNLQQKYTKMWDKKTERYFKKESEHDKKSEKQS